jgi:hypothetical protein
LIEHANSQALTQPRDDAILPATRLVAAGVIPFLLGAAYILYLRPAETGQRFAWEIAAPMTALFMGAGYLGGAYFFARCLIERRWHRVAAGFPPIAVYTAIMLAATLLHFDKFITANWAFYVWLVIYILTPILVAGVWLLNRRRDPGRPDADEVLLSPAIGRVLAAIGILLLACAALAFALPTRAAELWVWPLTPLTARVLAGWQALLGVGALTLSRERRWSGWRIPLQSILLWQALVLVASLFRPDAFGETGPLNWFTIYTLVGVLVAAALYFYMERRRREKLAA